MLVTLCVFLFPCCSLDVENELQQAEGAQQTHPAGSLVFGQVTPGPQPTGVHPPRCFPRPHLPAAAAAGGQPAPAAAPGNIHHLHTDEPLPHLHAETPVPVGQWVDLTSIQAGGNHASAGESVSPWEPMDL